MYRRDQHENHSLSSYFDDKDRTVPTITTPVSPLATTVAVASPQSKRVQNTQQNTSSGGASGWSTTSGGE